MYVFEGLNRNGVDSPFSIQSIFNGINLDEELTDQEGSFQTLTVSGRSNFANRVETTVIDGLDGAIEYENYQDSREISIKYKFEDSTNEGFQIRQARLNGLLTGRKLKLEFTDENAYFLATVTSNVLPEENSNVLIGTITFLCSEPFKFGPEQIKTGVDSVTLNNQGTAPTYPRIKLEIKKDTTFVAIGNGTDINMIGNYGDVDEKPFRREERVFWDEMGTLVGWSDTTTVEEGTISGTMMTNGDSFYTSDYGDGPRWHGPAKKKSIGGTLQDFQIDALLRQQGASGEVGSVEVLLLDVQSRVVAKIVLSKRSSYNMAVHARLRAGNEMHGHNIMDSRGEFDWVWAAFSGLLRIGRIGNHWYAYVEAIERRGSLYRSWIDRRGIASAPIAQIQVQLWKFGGTPASSTQRIDDIKVFKINSEADGIPYIALEDDVIEFDHENDAIYKNGELITKEKAFIASYFDLKPGLNPLVAEPRDAIKSVEVKYTEKNR